MIKGIEETDLRHMYDIEKMSVQAVADNYGVCHHTIYNRMKKYKIERRCAGGANNVKYIINKEFFNHGWDPEKAWLFGWFIGDGYYLTNHNGIGFGLACIDEEVLYKFKDVLGSDHPVQHYPSRDKRSGKAYGRSMVSFRSPKLASDIQELSYSDLPKECHNHFIRGFFEAEGSVFWDSDKRDKKKGGRIGTNFTNNDKGILNFIFDKLRYHSVVDGGGIYQSGNTYKLKFAKADSIALYRYIYSNHGNLFLKRKIDRFEELIEIESN